MREMVTKLVTCLSLIREARGGLPTPGFILIRGTPGLGGVKGGLENLNFCRRDNLQGGIPGRPFQGKTSGKGGGGYRVL